MDYSDGVTGLSPWLWAMLALIVLAAGFGGWRMLLARRQAIPRLETDLASNVRRHMAERGRENAAMPGARGAAAASPYTGTAASRPDPQPANRPAEDAAPRPAPSPSPAAPPLDLRDTDEVLPLDLTLAIISATRSVMMFTVEYRIALTNRTDKAVRDITLSARLTSAQKGTSNAGSLGAGTPIGVIDRIGPQQSIAVTATMQLPMVEVRAIRQGSTPVFIPLLHVTLEGAGQRAATTTFVIGTPSAATHMRLHPIALDTPPGSIRGLRANEIRALVPGETA